MPDGSVLANLKLEIGEGNSVVGSLRIAESVISVTSRMALLKSRPVTKVEEISSFTMREKVISPTYFPETIC